MDRYDSFDAQHGGDASQGAEPPFPPLVRPTPSYPDAYATILGSGNTGSDPRSSQTAFYDPENIAFGPGVMSSWGATGPGAFDPQTGPNYDYHQAAERAIEESYNHQIQQLHMNDRASNVHPFPPSSRLSQMAVSSNSPNIFGNHQHLQQVPQLSIPLNSSQPSSTSASPASTNSRQGYTLEPRPPAALTSGSAIAPFNTSPVSSSVATNAEPADAPWNLVPYSLPFASGRNNAGVPGEPSSSAAGTGASGAPLFLRSPTPTKRQRTSQACEKCRDRKAKCNGARPACQRCLQRGLPCEYAKERRLRGPNRPGNGHQTGVGGPMTEGVRQRIASSPARTSVANLAIPAHINGGQGLTPPDSTSGSITASNLRASPPPGLAHHRKQQLSTRLSPSPKVTGTPPLPVYRTLHVAQSHPDLHAYYSRPRSHTTPYPLAVNIPTHPSPLYQTMRSSARTDLSTSDLSEPPSATSSNFGSDLAAATFGRAVDVKGEPFPVSTSMRGDSMAMGQSIDVLGLSHGESDETLHLAAPHFVTVKREVPDNVFISAANASPEAYPSMDVGDDSQGDSAASVWQDRFGINIPTGGLLGGLSAVSTGSASASSNPSTSSPGPAGYRSHASAHSGGSIQETMGWNYKGTDQSYGNVPSPVQTGAQMSVDTPSANFITSSPKSDSLSFNASSSMGSIPSHANYPWTVDHNLDGPSSFPRISAPDQSGILSPTDNDFRNWIDVDGNQNRSAVNGSPVGLASTTVRSVAVLEVRD